MADQSGRAGRPLPADSLESLCAAHAPVTPSCRFTAGTIFGDWRITAFIGRGGNGEVYCAEHVSLGTPAAVKVLSRDDDRAKERFAREAKLLAKMRSKSFPRFFAHGEANGTAYLAMELLEPGDLPTGDHNVARFMLKVSSAVAELHSLGYIHRDIKPSNILWRNGGGACGRDALVASDGRAACPQSAAADHDSSADGRARSPVSPERGEPRKRWLQGCAPHPKTADSRACRPTTAAFPVLTDLGLAKEIASPGAEHQTSNIKLQTLTLGGVGTPGYGAPEQMERGEATVASDIHALGVLADACFRGNPPRMWARIIRRATSSIPAHRYPSVAAFARAIRRRNLLLGVSAFVAVIALSGLCLSCFYSWWTQSGREVWRWRALCDYGEIVSVSRICEPLDESHPKYPGSIVRYVTNRVDGTILNLSKDTLSFARPILLKPGEYRIVGPGRLDADLSGPSNAVVRLKDCVLNNTTSVPYPQNGIHYVFEGGAYLNFVNLDRNIEHRRYIHSDGKSRNALRFRGPMTLKELDEEQTREYEQMLQRDLR